MIFDKLTKLLVHVIILEIKARVAELVDAHDSKSCSFGSESSILSSGTMELYYDLLISIGITATAFPAVILLFHRLQDKKSWEYKHKKLSLIYSLVLLFGTTILLYGSFVEPRLLVTNEQTIDLPNIDEPITIAFVADFQVGPYKKTGHIQKVVHTILANDPDIVLIGGDQVDNFTIEKDETIYLTPLVQLAKQIPTYAVHGNHEYGVGGGKSIEDARYRTSDVSEQTKKALEKLGITYMTNDLALVTSTPSPIYLFGGDSWWAGKLDFAILKKREYTDIPSIALIHNPAAAWRTSDHNIDLMLSGHTHGGQIRLPFIGPVGRIDEITPPEWYQGLNKQNGMKLFVTSGTGETGTRARLFNPPEVVILTIK